MLSDRGTDVESNAKAVPRCHKKKKTISVNRKHLF